MSVGIPHTPPFSKRPAIFRRLLVNCDLTATQGSSGVDSCFTFSCKMPQEEGYFHRMNTEEYGRLRQNKLRNTKSVHLSFTFNKGGPIGSSLCEKMQFTSDARAPYMQTVETIASMATVKKILSQGFRHYFNLVYRNFILKRCSLGGFVCTYFLDHMAVAAEWKAGNKQARPP